MDFPWNLMGPILVSGIGVILAISIRNRRSVGVEEPAQSDLTLDRAELIALQGGWGPARDLAETVLRLRSVPARLRARAQLVIAECESGQGDEAGARQSLEAAGRVIRELPEDGDARALSRWHDLGLASLGAEPVAAELASPDDPAGAWQGAEIPHTLRIRVARYAVWRAHEETRHGRWDRARPWLEWSISIAEKVPLTQARGAFGPTLEREKLIWSLARSRASASAIDLGQVLWSLGETDEALRWLDRAIETLEGADLPPGQVALARALLVRALHEPPDPLAGERRRARSLERSRDVAAACDWTAARVLAARAEAQLAALRAAQGAGDEALALLRSALERVRTLQGEGAADLVAETLTSLGHLLEERGEFDGARAEYRRAFEAGRADADPDARRLAVVAGCHLHRLLHHADRPDEARALLAPLAAVVPTLAAPARTLLSALVARSRGHQQFRDGEREAADATLLRGEALATQVGGPESADLVRQLATERGNLALAEGRAADAEAHFARALEAPRGDRPEPVEVAERAEIVLRRGQTRLHLGRESEGRADLRQAFERGRDSGRSQGRSVAAVAALQLADTSDGSIEERRGLYEAAGRLGQLSGTERGRQVAAAVVERLRELTE